MYYKITNAEENHHGFQYVDGLNILKEKFNDDPTQSCCAGGFYFTDAKNIFKYLSYGIYLREVKLPTNDANFKMVKDIAGDKWRANMIILGKQYDLLNIDTFKYLIKQGADVHVGKEDALHWNAAHGHFDIVKYLIEQGANIHAANDWALVRSASNGHLDIVKYLVELGANIHSVDNSALFKSAANGHFDIVKYLVGLGANIFADSDIALRSSAENGHIDIVIFLVENGANIHACNDDAFHRSSANGYYNIVKYLKSKC